MSLGLETEIGGVSYPNVSRPHLLLHGPANNGQSALIAALMHTMEHCHIYSLDLPSLVADGSGTPQEACAHAFAEARKTPPSVVVLPQIDQWLPTADGLLVTTLTMLVQQLPPNMPLLLLGSTSQPFSKLSPAPRTPSASSSRTSASSYTHPAPRSVPRPSRSSPPTSPLLLRRRPLRRRRRR